MTEEPNEKIKKNAEKNHLIEHHPHGLCCHVAKEKLFDSTIHGCGMYFRSEHWILKVMWILFGIGAITYLIYLVTKSLIEYYKFEVAAKVNTYQDLPATFPAVTLCNINPFSELYAYSYLLSKFSKVACFNSKTGDAFTSCMSSNDTNAAYDSFLEQLKGIVANDNLNAYDHYWYGYDLASDMMISCTFNGIECTADDFIQYWDNAYGNCYSFNYQSNATKSLRKTSASGPEYGLKLQLVVIPPNYESDLAYKSGIFLRVHNQSDNPVTVERGINIAPGGETYVAIDRKITTHLSSPYSSCITSYANSIETYMKKLAAYSASLGINYYDQNFCFTLCQQDQLLSYCGCISISTPKINNATYCETDTQIECMGRFVKNFTTSNIVNLCKCPQQCETQEFAVTTSFAKFPTYKYLKLLATNAATQQYFPSNITDNITLDGLIKFADIGFMKVIINYDNLYYTKYEDESMKTIDSIMGEIGGEFGLCGGISLLNFMEFVGIMIAVCLKVHEQKKKEARLLAGDPIGSLEEARKHFKENHETLEKAANKEKLISDQIQNLERFKTFIDTTTINETQGSSNIVPDKTFSSLDISSELQDLKVTIPEIIIKI